MFQHFLVIGSFLLICGFIHWIMKAGPAKTIDKEIEEPGSVKKAV